MGKRERVSNTDLRGECLATLISEGGGVGESWCELDGKQICLKVPELFIRQFGANGW
jgi:hypothetical protein